MKAIWSLGRLVDDKGPHMFKSWFDRDDAWGSMLTNLHDQARVATAAQVAVSQAYVAARAPR